MLTSNTKGIFCDNVTCFGTNKSCSNRSHLQECFQYSSLLACKGTVSNLFSNWSFPHTPCNFPLYYMFPANCFQNILFQQAGISHGKKLIKSDIASDISAPWEHGSTSLDVNKANGMLTSNTKGIFCDNVTCFATNQTCSNGSHLQECFQYSSLRAYKDTSFDVFSNLSFLHTPCSFSQYVSCRLLSRHSVLTSWEFTYLPPASMKVTRLMSPRPNMQETRERFKKTGSLGLLQCSEIDSDCFEMFESQLGNPRI